jgi:hypothetical protein
MKTITRFLSILAIALSLAACAAPNATFSDGSVSGLSGAQATTLVKGAQRSTKVSNILDKQKPILKLVAHEGKPITIDAALVEVSMPIDANILLAEQPSEVSEGVQMVREVRGAVTDLAKVATPLYLADKAADVLMNDRKLQADERIANTGMVGQLHSDSLNAAVKEPVIIEVPANSYVTKPAIRETPLGIPSN